MMLSTHDAYLSHLSSQFAHHADNRPFWEALGTYTEELSCVLDVSLDPVRDALAVLYCPTGQGDPLDPVLLLRSWLLMTLCRETSPTVWARRLRREAVLAVMVGSVPGSTPGASTHRDFLARLADGPYAVRCRQDATLSQQVTGRHRRRLADATKARRKAADAQGMKQSEFLSDMLLKQADLPQNPYDLQTRLEDLFVAIGLAPTVAAGLLSDDLTVSGDGTIEPSGASSRGFRSCGCPAGSRCGCAREYLSATAQWCHDQQHGWIFGDRSYTISVHINHRDIPLMTILPGGNESDFTLSLKALDRLLTLLELQELPLRIAIFIGDGHHDAIGIYRYLKDKGIIPVVPLKAPPTSTKATTKATTKASTKAAPLKATAPVESPQAATAPDQTSPSPTTPAVQPRPQVDMSPNITFDADGVPVCPGGCRMRHVFYNTTKSAHIFACPATRKNRAGEWVFHADECPNHQRCTPVEKKMGLTHYIKSVADLRLFPPISRDSKRFKELYAHRTGIERQNSVADSYNVDRCHRNATFVLIRLTFVNICKHARLRDAERHATGGTHTRLHAALHQLELSALLPN